MMMIIVMSVDIVQVEKSFLENEAGFIHNPIFVSIHIQLKCVAHVQRGFLLFVCVNILLVKKLSIVPAVSSSNNRHISERN